MTRIAETGLDSQLMIRLRERGLINQHGGGSGVPVEYSPAEIAVGRMVEWLKSEEVITVRGGRTIYDEVVVPLARMIMVSRIDAPFLVVNAGFVTRCETALDVAQVVYESETCATLTVVPSAQWGRSVA